MDAKWIDSVRYGELVGLGWECDRVTVYGKCGPNDWTAVPCGREAWYERTVRYNDGSLPLHSKLCKSHYEEDLRRAADADIAVVHDS